MERKRKRHATADLRLLNFLKELYEISNENYVHISMHKEIQKHNLSDAKVKILTDNKIILRRVFSNGKTGKQYEWKWNTIKLNLKMAQKINDIDYENKRSYVLNRQKIDLFNQPKEEKVTTPKKSTHREKKVDNIGKDKIEVKQQKEFSLFWGLIKIKY